MLAEERHKELAVVGNRSVEILARYEPHRREARHPRRLAQPLLRERVDLRVRREARRPAEHTDVTSSPAESDARERTRRRNTAMSSSSDNVLPRSCVLVNVVAGSHVFID
jgi:hypothetical protein